MSNLKRRLLTGMIPALATLGASCPYGYAERPKRDVVFEKKEPHQDAGAVRKPVSKYAGKKKMSRAERKRLYGKQR